MFQTNSNHIQQDIFGYDLTQMNKVYARIKETAGYCFYETIFSNIDEEIFAPLYCQDNGRPNAPINTMSQEPGSEISFRQSIFRNRFLSLQPVIFWLQLFQVPVVYMNIQMTGLMSDIMVW
jgi:hypothetical protein